MKVTIAFVVLAAQLCMAFGFLNSKARFAGKQQLYMKNKIDALEIEGDLTPVINNVLICVKEAESETSGGIYIPDNAKERPTEGKVVAAGPGRMHQETGVLLDMSVKVGDNVIYGKYDGSELRYNDLNHQLIKDEDVLLTYPANEEPTLANIQCTKDQILVRLPKSEGTESGIILNAAADKKRPNYGTVEKTGPGRQAANGVLMTPQVFAGDSVRFRDFGGTVVKIEGVEYLVIRGPDVLAKW
jgi:chaperonin GroES